MPRPGASSFGAPKIDLDKLRGFKDDVVAQLTGGTGQLVKARKVKYLRGTATLLGPTSLDVATARWRHRAGDVRPRHHRRRLAAGEGAGPVHRQPARHGLDLGARTRERARSSLLVVGGGYIGLELGSVYATLGSKVTVVEMMPGLLPGADRDLVDVLAKKHRQGLRRRCCSRRRLSASRSRRTASASRFEDANLRPARPGVRESAGVGGPQAERDGGPRQDEGRNRSARLHQGQRAAVRLRSPRIYAIGDVAGDPMLAHKASARGPRRR